MMGFYGHGYFCLVFKEKKKSRLWTIASSSAPHSEALQVKSSSQQTLTRGAQLIRSLKTGSFLGLDYYRTSLITCTSSFCIKHLSDSSAFVFCSAVFSMHSHITSREIPQDCVLIHSQKDPFKAHLLLSFSFFYISHKVSLSA